MRSLAVVLVLLSFSWAPGLSALSMEGKASGERLESADSNGSKSASVGDSPAFEGSTTSLELREEDSESIVQIESKALLRQVPDIEFVDVNGKTQRFSELWGDKPLLVTLFYQRCTGSCSPFLRSLRSAILKIGGLGDEYRVVSLSFDPEDSVERVAELAQVLEVGDPEGWYVGVAQPEEVAAVAEAIGFWFQRIGNTEQFDHPSLIAAVRDGRVNRVLLGNVVSHPRFRELVLELKGVHVPFYLDPDADTLFRCLDVDMESGELKPGWGLLVMILPGMLAFMGAWFVFRRRKEG